MRWKQALVMERGREAVDLRERLRPLEQRIRGHTPASLKPAARAGLRVARKRLDQLRVREIDLRATMIGGYHRYDAAAWAAVTGDPRRAATTLAASPHVQFLRRYQELGPAILTPAEIAHTAYYQQALEAVRYAGDYFGAITPDEVRAQAAAFVTLYERIKADDPTPVDFPIAKDHSPRGSDPVVFETLTPGTYQIIHGHHRLAIAYALGRFEQRASVRGRRPAELQRLALSVTQTKRQRELYQPIDLPTFRGWTVTRRCADRLAMMLRFLAERGIAPRGRTLVDLACSYGWFVAQFAERGVDALGVEADPIAKRIGRIAYGLRDDQVVHSYLQPFLAAAEAEGCTFDITLMLSIYHHFLRDPRIAHPECILQQVDRLTGRVLFCDFGQAHEAWFADSLPEWNEDFIANYLRRHTSFSEVVKLGVDHDNIEPYQANYGRTLFACVRS